MKTYNYYYVSHSKQLQPLCSSLQIVWQCVKCLGQVEDVHIMNLMPLIPFFMVCEARPGVIIILRLRVGVIILRLRVGVIILRLRVGVIILRLRAGVIVLRLITPLGLVWAHCLCPKIASHARHAAKSLKLDTSLPGKAASRKVS